MKHNYNFQSNITYPYKEYSDYKGYTSQVNNPVNTLPTRTVHKPTTVLPKISKQTHSRLSDLLPKAVLHTLHNKANLTDRYKQNIENAKTKISDDIDQILKNTIMLFEDFKQQLFKKTDEHQISFESLLNQLEKLSEECSDWAEERVNSSRGGDIVGVKGEEELYDQLTKARREREKADAHEKALVAVKQKIEQLRLVDLNDDVAFLADNKNNIYAEPEVRRLGDNIKADIKAKLSTTDQSRIVKPFMVDSKKIIKSDNRVYISQKESSGVRREGNGLVVKPDFDSNVGTTEPIRQVNRRTNPPIIAQQNHFYSDNIDLSQPEINLENELFLGDAAKITCLSALTNRVVLAGNEDGNLLIVDVEKKKKNDPSSQRLIKAHESSIRLLKKTGNHLVLSVSVSPDNSIKIWDLGGVATNNDNKPGEVAMLVAVLKGHSSSIVGADFIGGRNIISASRDGVINIWDWKLSEPISSFRMRPNSINVFTVLSSKDAFVASGENNQIVSYGLLKGKSGYEFIRQGEIKEQSAITAIKTFRGNNDLLIVALASGEVKLISRRSGENLNTISGCNKPLGFLILTCMKNNPDVFLLAMESYGFKIADVDHSVFEGVRCDAVSSFKGEKMGEPSWQILDSEPGDRVFFVSINYSVKPNSIMVWSIRGSK